MKPISISLLERIKIILAEETYKSENAIEFIDKAAERLLELIQDEKKYH